MRFCPFCSAENADELAVCQACGRRLPPLPPRRARNAPPTGIQLPPRPAGSAAPPPIPSAARAKPATMPPPTPAGTPAPAQARPASPSSTQTGVPPGPQIGRDSAPALPPAPGFEEPTATSLLAPDPTVTRAAVGDQTATSILVTDDAQTRVHQPDDSRTNLLDAISPGPAAQRREAPPAEPRGTADPGRRRTDTRQPLSPGAFARSASSSQPPPIGNPLPRAPGAGIPSVTGGAASGPTPRAGNSTQPPPISGMAGPGSGPIGGPRPRAPSQPPPPPFDSTRARSPSSSPPPFGAPGAPPAFSRPISTFPAADTAPSAAPFTIEPGRPRQATGAGGAIEPPPTRINRGDTTDRPFTPPRVLAVPEIPEPGIVHAAKYAYTFARARWQRRGAIKQLGVEIKQDTEALDQVLGALGRTARGARVEGRVFSAENSAISTAEERIAQLQREVGEVEGRKAEENSRFVDVERERNEKLSEAERMVEEAQKELVHLEAQRRGLRDRRKELERRQKAFLKSAEDNDRQAGSAPMGDQRQDLRRSAEGHRREAAALEPGRQDLDRQLASLERPISECAAKLDAAKAELDAAKRSLSDAREGHTHRLAELDAEQKRKAREVALADSEIQRRLVTLGTLVNLNRIEDPQFAELYERIDRIRGAITARTTEIEKLTSEREAYDRRTMNIGIATIAGALVVLIALFVIFRAIL